MFTDRSTGRGFGARLAVLLPGLGFAGMTGETLASAAQGTGTVQKLDGEGKPTGKGFITPLIINNGLTYIAGQGAHSLGNTYARAPGSRKKDSRSVFRSTSSEIARSIR